MLSSILCAARCIICSLLAGRERCELRRKVEVVENNSQMYCEVLRKITPRIPVIPSFEVQYLTRVESLGDGCAI